MPSAYPNSRLAFPASRFPRHQVVSIPTALHAALDFRCGSERAQEFLATLGPVKGTCEDADWAWFVQLSFPLSSAGVAVLYLLNEKGRSKAPASS